jgi:hypothetical protein
LVNPSVAKALSHLSWNAQNVIGARHMADL